MSIEVKIAIGVGEKFAIVNANDVKHIQLKNTGTLVESDGEWFALYKGVTFNESQKVDNFFDENSVNEMYINEHLHNKKTEEGDEYDVTVTRYGCVKVRAKSAMEAMEKANNLPTESITWNEDWSATDAYRE